MSYGPNINVETAKKLAAPAIAEARKNNWNMAVAIVDTAGDLVYFEKMDDTQVGSVQVAQSQGALGGALQAADQGVSGRAGRRRRRAAHPRARRAPIPVEGGIPLVVGGKIVGAIGASGGTSQQDGVVAQAGASALK